jgi:(E)-4-hydroxy-3-methylbut-2-enyl-diphosphate synthase
MLWSLRLRPRNAVELIACPTCGRAGADVNALAERIRAATADIRAHVLVAVMGCVVNGPGEAMEADVAVCCAEGRSAIYRHGERIEAVANDRIVETLVSMIRRIAAEST